MNWRQYFGIKTFLRSSLWVVPFVAIPIALIATRLLHWLDDILGWRLLGFAVPGAQALLSATVTSTLSFVVFTFGSLLVAIQVAGAQLTPRIIATTLLRNDVVRYTVGLFILTLMLAIGAQNRMDKEVHQLVLLVVALLCICCFAAFFFLIGYASRWLLPVTVLTQVGDVGLAVIGSVYPDQSRGADGQQNDRIGLGQPARTVSHQGTSGIVLAVNLGVLKNAAEKSDGVVEVVPQVGDFV